MCLLVQNMIQRNNVIIFKQKYKNNMTFFVLPEPFIYTVSSMFLININITEFDKIVFVRCLVDPIIQYCGLCINIRIFRHLKLEIALAIPASNDEK